jgi:hypothetical protein
MHIDDFLDTNLDPELAHVREWFEHARAPAIVMDRAWLAKHRLFCSYQGRRYRCTGASRLGDVWLAADHGRIHGYDLRVDVSECCDWAITVDPAIQKATK